MEGLLLQKQITDTISVIDTNKVVDFYSDLLEKQSTQFGLLLTAIISIFTILIGVSWWWNISGMKNQLKNEVDAAKNSMKEDLDEWKNKSKTEFNKLINEKGKEIDGELQKQLKHHEAELDRLYGSACVDNKGYISGAEWLFSAFELYKDMDEGIAMELTLDGGIEALKDAVSEEEINDEKIERIKNIEEIVNKIPEVYHKKGVEAKNLIKQLKAKRNKTTDVKQA